MIKDANDAIVEGYTVDAYFNIKGKDVDANLFEADSPFQVWPTDYLYLTTSEDAGATWSVPTIVNMRKDHEQSLLVGPGRGSYLRHMNLQVQIKIAWLFIRMMAVRRGKEESLYLDGVQKQL